MRIADASNARSSMQASPRSRRWSAAMASSKCRSRASSSSAPGAPTSGAKCSRSIRSRALLPIIASRWRTGAICRRATERGHMSHSALSGDALLSEFTAAVTRSGVAYATVALLDRLQRPPLLAADILTDVVVGLVRTGFGPVAIEVADAAMRHFPQVTELRYWRANALRLCALHNEAEQGFRALLRDRPDHRDAALSLAFMLREQGRIDAAAHVIVALANAHTGDASQTLALLAFLRECGTYAQAFGIATAARKRWPQDAALAAITGELALALGEFDTAREALRDALTRDPGQAAAWLRVAHCQRYENSNDPDLRRFETARANPALGASARICAGFALGKALDDLGD